MNANELLKINGESSGERKCLIMGILNVTPDSFSDGGKWNGVDAALRHAEEMIDEGADIIDIGGESTRPGHEQISVSEEIERVLPVIEAVKARFDIPVSLDTYKSEVAAAGIKAGADILNDIWGFKYDGKMAVVVADADVPCILMHNRESTEYDNYPAQVFDELKERVDIALSAGVKRENIILDPGIGFGKTYEQNLILMNDLEKMNDLGLPWLLGTSRKSMIGLTLDLPADERVEGTIATSVIGVMKGCSILRVHDVKENLRAVRMTEAILNV